MKKIGILTSGGDCGGLNAAVRSIFYRAKNTYGMEVLGIQDGTVGLMQRPVAYLPLDYQTIIVYLLINIGNLHVKKNKYKKIKIKKKKKN
jgi:6-phosphofructokinase